MSIPLYLFVDFENLQPPPEHVARVRGEHSHLWVFHGPHQNKFDVAMINAWKSLGDRLQLVQSSKNGKNALDFHIAYFLGVLCNQSVVASRRPICIVVTGDGGFDALFDFLRGKGCAVDKAGSIPEALALAARMQARVAKESETKAAEELMSAGTTLTEEHVGKIVAGFVSDPRSRPASRSKLDPYVLARLGNKVAPAVAEAVVEQLIKRRVVTFDGEKINYSLPATN